MFPLFAALIFASGTHQTMEHDYVTQHVRPSRIVRMITQQIPLDAPWGQGKSTQGSGKQSDSSQPAASIGTGLIPAGVQKITADDVRGVITLQGTKEAIGELVRNLSMFDVQRRSIAVKIEILSPMDTYASKTETTVVNAASWGMTDRHLDLGLNLTTRINDDGTLTCLVDAKYGNKSFKCRRPLRNGETFTIQERDPHAREHATMTELGSDELIKDWEIVSPGVLLGPRTLKIRITASVVETPSVPDSNSIPPTFKS